MSPTEDSIDRWRCGGLNVEHASKQLRLFERAMVHVSGPGCQRLCSPQVRMLVERLWKRLGALEDTGQSTTSVGVGTSWRGLYIHVQMPVSRSQVPFFQEKVWKRRGALEFTGRSTASVGVCTSWRGLYIHVQMPVKFRCFLKKSGRDGELSSSLGALPPLSEIALPGEVRIHVEMPVSRWGWGHVNRLGKSQVKAESYITCEYMLFRPREKLPPPGLELASPIRKPGVTGRPFNSDGLQHFKPLTTSVSTLHRL